jgi:hypothetical protein
MIVNEQAAAAIVIQMGSDARIPRSAVGYVADLKAGASATVILDRLRMLSRYVPDLVNSFVATAMTYDDGSPLSLDSNLRHTS